MQCTMAEPPGQPSPTSMHKRLGNTLPSLAGQERYGVPHTGLRSLATDLFWRSRYYAHCRLIDWACVQISHSFLKHGRSFTVSILLRTLQSRSTGGSLDLEKFRTDEELHDASVAIPHRQ